MKFTKRIVISVASALAVMATVISPLCVNADDTKAKEKGADGTSQLELVIEAKDSADYNLPVENVSISADNFAMANITAEADVYSAADAASEVCGKIYPTTDMEVLVKGAEWTQIKTGNLTGYVPSSELMFGDAGRVLMNAKCDKACVAQADTQLYTAADTAADVAGNAVAGDIYTVEAQLSGWVQISGGSTQNTAYAPADTMVVQAQTTAGKTIDELNQEAAAQAAAEAEAAKAAQAAASAAVASQNVSVSNGAAVSASSDETDLLAHLLYCEAGTNYDNCVAVGAVVMNRVKSSSFPNSISEVIYQSGQFSPTWNGALDRAYANGVPQVCYDAANKALSGYSNVGGCLYFHAGSGGTYTIGDNTFY